MDEDNKRKLLENEKVTKGPSVRIIEDGMTRFLNKALTENKNGYVSLEKDEDLRLLKLEIKKIEAGRETERNQIVALGDAVLTFNCDSQKLLIDEDREINMYFWNIKKIENRGLELDGIGEMKHTISLAKCGWDKRKEETTCDLKVVTKTKW